MKYRGRWGVVAFVACAHASSPAYPPGGRGPVEEPAEFSCNGSPLDLSREELEKLALAEHEKRGGRLRPGEFQIKLKRSGCDWWVGVTLLPAAPGAHFGVLIDGLTGKVKHYLPGG
jgi:hypothetical protein